MKRPVFLRRSSLLPLLTFASLAAADIPVVQRAAAQARQSAESERAETRSEILDQRAAESRSLREAVAAADAARSRLLAARQARTQNQARANEVEQQRRRGEQHIRQQLDQLLRAAGAGSLGPTETPEAGSVRLHAALADLEQRLLALASRLKPRQGVTEIVLRDGRTAAVPVLDLGARAAALGNDAETRGALLALAGSGTGPRWRLAPALPRGDGMTIDIDGAVAGRAAVEHQRFWPAFVAWIEAGRLFIWPILAVLVTGLILSIARGVALWQMPVRRQDLDRVLALLRVSGPEKAMGILSDGNPLDRVLGAGLAAHQRGPAAREAAIDEALLMETGRLQAGLSMILVLAGIAPLLGLLGTVTGMINLFAVIAAQGSGSAKALSGGISEALITAQAGMIAAIPLLLLHALLSRSSERRLLRLEEAACALLAAEQVVDAATSTGIRL
jgi:biopolymer transport protein ExbB